jgi:hypothetical protein
LRTECHIGRNGICYRHVQATEHQRNNSA